MSSESDDNEIWSPETLEVETTNITIPEKSKKKYDHAYNRFMNWHRSKNIHSFSELVLVAYFGEIKDKYKSSSLWAHYSMLRCTLNINHNVNIESYSSLRALLKRKSVGYQAKKAKTFKTDEICKFINEAPDDKYLATKVALIMGVMGACRANELYSMTVDNFQDFGSAVLVTVPSTRKDTVRNFTIVDNFYEIYKKYANLRPPNIATTSFFLNYHNGKCSTLRIGINNFGSMGKSIASYLKLPNPSMYTGHCFRKSSATLLADLNALKRYEMKSSLMKKCNIDSTTKNNNTDMSQSTSTSTEEIPINNYRPIAPLPSAQAKNVEFVSKDNESSFKFEEVIPKIEIEDESSMEMTSVEVSTSSSNRRKTNNDDACGQLKEITTTTTSSKYHRDQCRTFGDFVVDKLRTFDSRLQTVAQHKIHGILYELEMSTYNQPKPHNSYTSPTISQPNRISSETSSPDESESNASEWSS